MSSPLALLWNPLHLDYSAEALPRHMKAPAGVDQLKKCGLMGKIPHNSPGYLPPSTLTLPRKSLSK